MTERKIIIDREEIKPADIKPNMDFDSLASRVINARKASSRTKKIISGASIGSVVTIIIIGFYFLKLPIQKSETNNTLINDSARQSELLAKEKLKEASEVEKTLNQQKTTNNVIIPITKGSTRKPALSNTSGNGGHYSSLENFYKRKALPYQLFTIASNRDTTITGAQGTKLVIKANSFVDAQDQSATGQITIKLKECYTVEDMLREGLTTMANNKILESGGMIYIEARAGDKQLKLKKFEEIEMYNPIPEVMADTNMFVFYGKTNASGDINWTLDNTSRIPYPIATITGGKYHDTASIAYFANHFRFAKEKMIKTMNKKDSIPFTVSFNELMKPVGSSGGAQDLLPGTPLCEFLKLCENNYVPPIQGATRETPFQFKVLDEKSHQTYFNEFKAYKADTNLRKGNFKLNYDSTDVFYSRKNAPFYIGTIGWVNCDKFNMETVDLNQIHFALNSAKDEDLKLVFYSGRRPSIIKAVKIGNTWHFPNIPVNKKVTVTGSLLKNGEVYTASKVFKVQKQETLHKLEYKPKPMP